MENKARGCGQETNIARGEAKCYIWIKTTHPECFIYRNREQGNALTGLKCFLLVVNISRAT